MAEYTEHSRNEHGNNGNFLYRLSALEDKVEKHDQDLYRGNGKPGITTRVLMSEETITKISGSLAKLVWLGVATLFTVIGFVVEQTVMRVPH